VNTQPLYRKILYCLAIRRDPGDVQSSSCSVQQQ